MVSEFIGMSFLSIDIPIRSFVKLYVVSCLTFYVCYIYIRVYILIINNVNNFLEVECDTPSLFQNVNVVSTVDPYGT